MLGTQTENYYREVEQIIAGLQQKYVYIQRKNSDLYLNWLASIEYFYEQECVELEFTQKIKPYLLELKKKLMQIEPSE